jgi:hypothetical protein
MMYLIGFAPILKQGLRQQSEKEPLQFVIQCLHR